MSKVQISLVIKKEEEKKADLGACLRERRERAALSRGEPAERDRRAGAERGDGEPGAVGAVGAQRRPLGVLAKFLAKV